MGLFPNAIAWPRKGMLEGMNGGYFCRKKHDNSEWCIQAYFDNYQQQAKQTYLVTVGGLFEQHFWNVSDNESDERGSQNHGGQVLVHFSDRFPEQFTAHFIKMKRHICLPPRILSSKKQFNDDFNEQRTIVHSLTGCSPSDARLTGQLVISPQQLYLSIPFMGWSCPRLTNRAYLLAGDLVSVK